MDHVTRSLFNMVGNLADLERIRAKNFVLVHEVFSLHDLAREVQESVRFPASGADQARLLVDLDFSDDIAVIGDRPRLHHLLLHLVEGVAGFSNHGKILLNFFLTDLSTETANVRIAVSIEEALAVPENVSRMFQTRGQLNSEMPRTGGGTGVTLPLVAHLVEMMGGQVEVTSSEDQGTRFEFQLSFGVDKQEMSASPRLQRIGLLGALNGAVLSHCWASNFETHRFAHLIDLFTALLDYRNRLDVLIVDADATSLTTKPSLRSLLDSFPVDLRPQVLAVGEPNAASTEWADAHLPTSHDKQRFSEVLDSLMHRERAKGEASAERQMSRSNELQNRSVLLVDDSDLNRTLMKRILEKLGAHVTTAGDGPEAISTATESSAAFDLILMDVKTAMRT
jgi:CheY-like chemotaxis protein